MSAVVSDVNRGDVEWSALEPHTSLIIACYAVEEYLPAFLASLDAQTADHSGYELIFVIDGCPEGSERVVRDWMAGTDFATRIVVKPNGGVASARNAGLDFARGEWISAPDPDDVLDPEYLLEIEGARSMFPEETMFVGRIRLKSSDGADQRHPLDFRFEGSGTRRIDLTSTPEQIQTLGGVVFLSRALVTRDGLRFNAELPQASDTDFLMHFLISNGGSYVLVPSAEYEYLRRVDGSSIVVKQAKNVSRYKITFGVTHRLLLDRAGGECPPWLSNMLLYFVYMLFRRNLGVNSPVALASERDLSTIRDLLRENLRRMGDRAIQRFSVAVVPIETRMAWLAALGPLQSSPVVHLETHPARDAWRVSFYSSSSEPLSGLKVEAGESRVLETKVRRVEFLGATWVYQHIVLLSGSRTRGVRLGCGAGFEFEFDGAPVTGGQIRRALDQVPPRAPQNTAPAARGRVDLKTRAGIAAKIDRLRVSVPLRVLSALGYRKRYAHAWVLSDGETRSGGNAEAIFRYLRGHRPDVNAWFVASGAEYDRLRRATRRVVRYGSHRHFALMKCADVFVTSELGALGVAPFAETYLPRTWRSVHTSPEILGAAAYRRVNSSPIDVMAVSSPSEERLLSRNGGDFRFLQSETALTGMPKFDALPAHADEPGSTGIVVAPAWRSFLIPPEADAAQLTALMETRYLQTWMDVLGSQRLHAASETVQFLVPEELTPVLDRLTVPRGVSPVVDRAAQDRIVANARLLVTDYSQRVFEATYCDVPVVFFAFDREDVLGEADSLAARAFDEQSARLGPVARSIPEVLDAIEGVLQGAHDASEEHSRHRKEFFAHRDGKSSARVVAAIEGRLEG